MSLQKRREEEKAERHDRRRIEILEAAEQLFQSKGIKQTKSTIGRAFGTNFRYVIGLKASCDDDYLDKVKLDFKNFAHFVLMVLKNTEE